MEALVSKRFTYPQRNRIHVLGILVLLASTPFFVAAQTWGTNSSYTGNGQSSTWSIWGNGTTWGSYSTQTGGNGSVSTWSTNGSGVGAWTYTLNGQTVTGTFAAPSTYNYGSAGAGYSGTINASGVTWQGSAGASNWGGSTGIGGTTGYSSGPGYSLGGSAGVGSGASSWTGSIGGGSGGYSLLGSSNGWNTNAAWTSPGWAGSWNTWGSNAATVPTASAPQAAGVPAGAATGGQCTPNGTNSCRGNSVIDSCGNTIQVCTPSQICRNGRCIDTSCVPNGVNYCSGNNVVDSCGNIVETCRPGLFCSGGQCIARPSQRFFSAPTASLKAVPTLIARNDVTNVSWSAANVARCTVTGSNGDGPWTCVAARCDATTTKASSPITGETTYTLSCTGLDDSTLTKSATVKLVPVFKEI